nr:serine/threonine-protein phosphatase 7 long form homolog [Ipomoea batatas]
MANSSQDMIMEEREALMVSPTGGQSTLRTAHFLNPSITSLHNPLPLLPRQNTAAGKPKLTFRGWKNSALKDWGKWVEEMRNLHESAWKKAGIYDAVMNSTHIIHRSDALILGFAGKWRPETKTFVFPWGEVSLTLEDMIVLGGFSVLGDCVDPDLSPIGDRKWVEIKSKLLKARSEIYKTCSKKITHGSWIAKFIGSGSEVEHEAFLVLWLEKFVFPISAYETIGTKVLDIAIRLARGNRIALAPAVLASIYQNLGLMKEALVEKRGEVVMISAPFQLVQVWAWERFPSLRPNPNSVGHDKPRFARWDEVKMEGKDVVLAIDSAGDDFCWRPYTLGAKNPRLYKEQESWMLVGDGLDEEMEALVRCLRASELVGVENCIEQYLPHRVAMQFGMDQDVPGHVRRADRSPETAWEFYTRPVLDKKLYLPPRLFESDVTFRYLQWREKSAPKRVGIKAVVKRKSCKISDGEVLKSGDDPIEADDHITLAQLVSNPGKTSIHIEPAEKQPEEQGDVSKGIAGDVNRCNVKNGRSKDLVHISKVQEKGKLEDEEEDDLSENRPTGLDRSNGRDCSVGTSKIPGMELEKRIRNLENWIALIRRKI